jgi:hypothetical protein
MSNDQEDQNAPPEFGFDDDNNKNDDSLFVSVLSPTTVDVSLSGGEDEDDNPFGQPAPPAREKTPTNTTNTVESSVDNEKNLVQQEKSMIDVDEDDEDVFGVKTDSNNAPVLAAAPQVPVTVPEPPPPTPVKQESPSFSVASNTSSPSPVQSKPTFDKQVSSSTPVSKTVLSETVTTSKSVQKRSNINDIEITVSDPSKVGDVSSIIIRLILIILSF